MNPSSDRTARWLATGVLGATALAVAACASAPATREAPGTATVTSVGSPSPVPVDATPSPTVDARATVIAEQAPRQSGEQVSPDGRWVAEVRAWDCFPVADEGSYAFDQLSLREVGSGVSETVYGQLRNCEGLGAVGIGGRFWSSNSRYYYFTNAAIGVPDGGCGYWAPPLLRMSVEGKAVEDIGIAAVSPDGERIAAWRDGRIGVWETGGPMRGEVANPEEGSYPGPMAWRPDGQSIALLTSDSGCPPGETHLVRMSLAEMRPIVILSYRDPLLTDLRWDAPNRLTLLDDHGRRWRYNFETRDLWPID